MIATLDPITAELVSSGADLRQRRDGDRRARRRLLAEHQGASRSLVRALRRDRTADRGKPSTSPSTWVRLPWGLRRSLAWLAERGRTMRAGEMVVVNDRTCPGRTSTTSPSSGDLFTANRLVGYAATRRTIPTSRPVPGSFRPTRANLFARARCIRPTVLVRDDRVVDETVISSAPIRVPPEARAGDLRAQIAGNNVGERRFLSSFERYVASTWSRRPYEKALDDGKRRTRAALRAAPPTASSEHEDVMEDGARRTVDRVARGGSEKTRRRS